MSRLVESSQAKILICIIGTIVGSFEPKPYLSHSLNAAPPTTPNIFIEKLFVGISEIVFHFK